VPLVHEGLRVARLSRAERFAAAMEREATAQPGRTPSRPAAVRP